MSVKPRRPVLFVLAGGNGAGKSTFYHKRIKPLGMPFINADEIAREVWPENPEAHSYDAMKLAEASRREALERGISHCFETVFSHPSKLDFLQAARSSGFEINLFVIHLQESRFNVERVAQRILEGGHSVPTDKILARLPRTVMHLKQAVALCDKVALLDNSYIDRPFILQAQFASGKWAKKADPMAEWASAFIAESAGP